MLENIFNTMRVLVEGPKEKEDLSLIPSDLFDTKTNFDHALEELFELNDGNTTYEFLRLCICIDTNINSRINDESGQDGDMDWEGQIKPSEYVALLRTIDSVFASSESTYGIGVMEGTVNRNPRYSGLSGHFLQVFTDTIGDPADMMFNFIRINRELCETNPSTLDVWWTDTLTNIYSMHEVPAEDDVSNWFSERDETVRGTIEYWYLKMNPLLQQIIDNNADIFQNEGPISILYGLASTLVNDCRRVYELYEGERVCENFIEYDGFPRTIEDVNFKLLGLIAEI